ncbi:MAG: DUF1997 domain-containing protein [Synechocystis sp.]|nr:DUF1997 domain-containing protein [Synechocystis sp.]
MQSQLPLTNNITPLATEAEIDLLAPVHFQTQFQGRMDMFATKTEVDTYLQAHHGWFCRCAQPMQVDPLGEHGYVLTIGQFGALGFDVEPKIAVVLEPPDGNNYYMHTVPLPDPTILGYEVDYQALMTLQEVDSDVLDEKTLKQFTKNGSSLPAQITKVEWELKMDVAVQFPRYIYKIPMKLIQSTGDRLLTEIVRQVSPRLTFKVQQDFHQERNLPLPPKSGRYFQRVTPNVDADKDDSIQS